MDFPKIPGYGFYPTDDQIFGYLKERVNEHIQGYPSSMASFFPEVDPCQFQPWDIPRCIESSLGHSSQYEWYFLSPREGSRNGTKRTVPNVGYWKVTGKKQDIVSGTTRTVIGTKSILVFHGSGRDSSSSGNDSWVIHEYHLSPSYLGFNIQEMPFVACVLKKK